MGRQILIAAVFAALTYATTASADDLRRVVADQIDKVRFATRAL
jgi:hypothetical protein